MRSKVLQAMDIFADERHFRLRLFFEGLLIGALTGALIAVFRYLLEGSEDLRRLAYHWLRTAEPGWFLLYGAAFLLAAFLLHQLGLDRRAEGIGGDFRRGGGIIDEVALQQADLPLHGAGR